MHVTIDLALIGQLVAIGAAMVAIFGWWHQRRTYIVAEGKNVAKIEALVGKVETQERKIADLESKAHCTDMDMAEIKSDIKYLIGAVNEIKEALGTIAPHTVKL